MSEDNSINYVTEDELLAEILADDPTFVEPPASNIINLRKSTNIDDIKILDFQQIEDKPPNPTQYVMSPIIPQQGIIFIYAATGVGKTIFTLNLAYAIAAGGRFLKYSCPIPRKVLYVDGEMAYCHMYDRLMMIKKQQGDLDFKGNFKLLTPDICHVRIPQLDNEFGQKTYLDLIEKYDIEVIVFDNISTLTSFDENKAHEWKIVQDFQVYLRSKGKTIINVHHAGKDKNGYRGTSKMLDTADLAISLQPIMDDQVDDRLTAKKFKIIYQKPRLLVGKDALPFEVIFEHGYWSYQSIEISMLDKVLECVNSKMSQRDIAKELLIPQTTVHRMIKKLRTMGKLIND
jgi:RecA-family ATPase